MPKESNDMNNQILYALAAVQDYPAEIKCPSEEKIASLVDERLSPDERDKMFDHLDICPSCNRLWLSVHSSKDLKREAIKNKIFKTYIPIAVAACLLLYLIPVFNGLLFPTSIEKLLATSYTIAIDQNITSKHVIFPLEKEINSLGFNPKGYSNGNKAFWARFWQGKIDLTKVQTRMSHMPKFLTPDFQNEQMKNKTWAESSWAIYYWIGYWCNLEKSVCESGLSISSDYFSKQQRILEMFQTDLSAKMNETADSLNTILNKINVIIDRDFSNSRKCKSITTEVNVLIDFFINSEVSS